MKFGTKILLFLILNFGGLAIGSLLMGGAATGDWYQSLNKAPWTPPGWVFGAAWTVIMICFSVYMSRLTEHKDIQNIALLFGIQWVLNVAWNYIFFAQHWVLFGLIEISALLLLIGYFLFTFREFQKKYTWLIAPYFVWMIIATSLNGYIYFYN